MFNDNVFPVFDFAQEFLSLYKLSSNFFADKHYYWQLYKCRDNLTSTCLSMTLNLIDLPWVFSYNYERMYPVYSYHDNAINIRLRIIYWAIFSSDSKTEGNYEMPILPWVYLWLDKICWLTCVTFMALNVCLYLGRILVYNSSLYYCKSKLRLYNIIKKIHNFFILHYTSIYEVSIYIKKCLKKFDKFSTSQLPERWFCAQLLNR